MNVFNNQQRSGYEEISSYGPNFYKEILEMDTIYRLAGMFADMQASDLEYTVASVFLDYMDDTTFSRYEAFLEIANDSKKTLEERKAYVSALLIGSGKISKDKIIAIVNQFVECDCAVVLDGTELYINMTFADDPSKYMNDIRKLIADKMPNHIEIIYHGAEGLNIVVQLVNIVTLERTWNRMDFYLYTNGQVVYLDGSVLLDGSLLLGNILDLYPVRDRHKAEMEINENFGAEKVTIKKNLYYLDGSLMLDGQTLLNADERKEEL